MVAQLTQSDAPSTPPKGGPRLGDLLIAHDLITQDQLGEALAAQKAEHEGKLLGEILIALEFVTEAQVTEVLAETYGVPYARLTQRLVDPAVFEVLDLDYMKKQLVVPLFLVQNRLTVAVAEPANVFLVEELERLSSHQVQIVAVTATNIKETLDHYTGNQSAIVIDEMIEDIQDNDLTLVESSVKDAMEVTDLESAAGDSPVIKLVNYVIFTAVHEGASDIHIEPDENTLRVRFRVDGSLYQKLTPPYALAPAVSSRVKILAGLDISERRLPQDGAITVMVNKNPVDLRISTMPSKFGEKIVMRIIDKREGVVSLDKLGFSFKMLEQFRDMVRQPNGVVLVTGPTGSGKSTTLYGVLAELMNETVNISTVEDPVEYNLLGINQFQTNDKAGFNFASALRSLLRQDPDIVMVGEIRDQETAKIATQAALTGHLVLSTLHTNDAPSAVTRLVNVGVEPYLVAASIRGVLAQRLVRKICNHCKELQSVSAKITQVVERMMPDQAALESAFVGNGCSKCRQRGISGRAGLFELFSPNDAMLDAISGGATLQDLRRMARETERYTDLFADGLDKVRAGLISADELMTVVSSL